MCWKDPATPNSSGNPKCEDLARQAIPPSRCDPGNLVTTERGLCKKRKKLANKSRKNSGHYMVPVPMLDRPS